MSSESKETRNFSQNKFNEPAHLIAEDDLNSWKRSKSDASFFPGVENHETEKTGGPTGNVSEHAMVYWNLPEAVEASDSDALLFAMSHTGDDDSKLQTTIPEQTYEMQRIVAKSEKIAMKADTSEVHVHRVHFKDGHPRQLSSSSPQKDEFCRRQSSPASPYDSSVRTAETHVAILTDHRTSRLQTDETLDIEKSYSTVLSEKATHYAHYGGSALESTRQVISGSMNSEFLRKVNEISMNAMHRLRPSDSTATAPSLFRTKSLEEEEGKAEEKSPSFELGSFEELQKNMSLQFEKLRLFSQLDRSTGTKDNEGIKSLVDGEYEALTYFNELLTNAHWTKDSRAESAVRTMFKQNGLPGHLFARLGNPRLDRQSSADGVSPFKECPTTSNTSKAQARAIATQHKFRAPPRSAYGLWQHASQLETPDLNEPVDINEHIDEQLDSKNREILVLSARLLNQLLSCENLASLLSTEVDHEDTVSSAGDDHSSSMECTDRIEQDHEVTIQANYVPCTGDTLDTNNTTSKEICESGPDSSELTDFIRCVVDGSWQYRNYADVYRECMALLEALLKPTEHMCQNVIDSGGVRNFVFACRSNDLLTLRHTALGFFNLALFGGRLGQIEMNRQHAIDWLFRLATYPDEWIAYFACLTSALLHTNPSLATSVANSGVLELIRPFVSSHSPVQFAREQMLAAFPCVCQQDAASTDRSQPCDKCYFKCSIDWLEQLLPALSSELPEARILAVFHFAVEATLKSDTDSLNVFTSIGAVDKLYRNASSLDPMESELANLTLELLGQPPLPHRLTPHVPRWTVEDVQCWLSTVGFEQFMPMFAKMQVDGDLLLGLTEATLRQCLHITNAITRLRLLRSVCQLKLEADYTTIDPTKLAQWLRWASILDPTVGLNSGSFTFRVGADAEPSSLSYEAKCPRLNASANLAQYTHNLIAAGVDRSFLPLLTDTILSHDCHIFNGVHRTRILMAAQASQSMSQSFGKKPLEGGESSSEPVFSSPPPHRPLDVFISYRRSTGSQLASLLKVHLQQRGYRVFLDIERLAAGKFNESLLHSISSSNNFLLVLTPNALDRCLNDVSLLDWIHRETVWALRSKCNVIPVTDSFEWPSEDLLPEDMRPVLEYNAVNWVHDYQDACIAKVEKFMVKRSDWTYSVTGAKG